MKGDDDMTKYKWVYQLPPHIKSELLRDCFTYLVGVGYSKAEAVAVVEEDVTREKIINVIEPDWMWDKYIRLV